MDSCLPIYEKLGLVTCYDTIGAEIDFVINAGANAIVLHINSPGGTVSGVAEGAAMIVDCAVPIVAHCKGLACSAAYYLAAGCTEIIATPSATVGNIGTILSWADCSEFWREAGIEFKALTNEGADLKSTFHLEPNEAQLAFLRDDINRCGSEFKAHVSAHREVDEEVWRAGWYSGEQAGILGLIDGIGSAADAESLAISLIS
jgi:protease-4